MRENYFSKPSRRLSMYLLLFPFLSFSVLCIVCHASGCSHILYNERYTWYRVRVMCLYSHVYVSFPLSHSDTDPVRYQESYSR